MKNWEIKIDNRYMEAWLTLAIVPWATAHRYSLPSPDTNTSHRQTDWVLLEWTSLALAINFSPTAGFK